MHPVRFNNFVLITAVASLLMPGLSGLSQNVKLINFSDLDSIITQKTDTTYVVNFWATWCGPCIKELPLFIEADKELKVKKVSVILVSLDDPDDLESKVKPFTVRRKIKLPVFVLNGPDPNSWMPKVDKTWTGAIPATLIFKGKKRTFHEKSMTREELYQAINQINK